MFYLWFSEMVYMRPWTKLNAVTCDIEHDRIYYIHTSLYMHNLWHGHNS